MKTIKIPRFTCFIFGLLSLTAFSGRGKITEKEAMDKTGEKGFAVLELFTSEGCSSCPPADNLMSKIHQELRGKSVYLLAYHVDYWDRQGWKDMFSSADFSKRQTQYGNWLHVSPIYTPQVIVNGKTQFVGSDESAIRNAIKGQLVITPVATLMVQTHQVGEKLVVEYRATKTGKDSRLLIAILQKAAQTSVVRGENAGQTLSHVQIVRKLQNEPVSTSGMGSITVSLPGSFNIKDWEVLGLVQNQQNGEILAAAQADLNGGANPVRF